jgi:hypothetical protein
MICINPWCGIAGLVSVNEKFISDFSLVKDDNGEAAVDVFVTSAFVKTVKNPEINPALKTVLLQTEILF